MKVAFGVSPPPRTSPLIRSRPTAISAGLQSFSSAPSGQSQPLASSRRARLVPGNRHQALGVDKRSTCPPNDVGEFRAGEQHLSSVKTVKQHHRRGQVQSLCQGRGRHGHLDVSPVQEPFDLASERPGQRSMMDGHAELETPQDRVVGPEPLGADGERLVKVDL